MPTLQAPVRRTQVTECSLVVGPNALRREGAGEANLPFSALLVHSPKSSHQSDDVWGTNQGTNQRARPLLGWLGLQPGTGAERQERGDAFLPQPRGTAQWQTRLWFAANNTPGP